MAEDKCINVLKTVGAGLCVLGAFGLVMYAAGINDPYISFLSAMIVYGLGLWFFPGKFMCK